MSRLDDGDRPVDRFDAARRSVLQHVDGGTCFDCAGGTCEQNTWALDELRRHPGGRQLLERLRLPTPTPDSTQEGQPR